MLKSCNMNNKINIRFIQKDDLKQLVSLCKKHAVYEEAIYEIEGKEESLEKNLFSKDKTLFCIVIEKDSELIGYMTYMKQFSTWDCSHYVYMDCLFLDEKSRNLGLGEKLIQRLKKEAIKLDCKLIQWQTPTFNTKAIKFYNKIGAYSKTKERFFLDL